MWEWLIADKDFLHTAYQAFIQQINVIRASLWPRYTSPSQYTCNFAASSDRLFNGNCTCYIHIKEMSLNVKLGSRIESSAANSKQIRNSL